MTERVKIMDGGLPFPIMVYFVQRPYEGGGITEPLTGKVGQCQTEAEVPALIAKDKQGMGSTMGGLFSPWKGQHARSYHVFRAEWTRLDTPTC